MIEQLSLVQNFRAQFKAAIQKDGLDTVIARMEKGEFKTNPGQSPTGSAQSSS
jgi:hypothetical protein